MNRKRSEISTLENTRYEVALMRGSEIVHVLGFTPRKSKFGIQALCTQNLEPYFTAEEWAEAMEYEPTYSAKYGYRFSSTMRIAFTGRTEREVASAA